MRAHTNATFVVGDQYGFADGLFAGFDEAASNYDRTAWDYERGPDGYVRRDPSLSHPRSVFQLLKQHYDRYTPEVVADIAGCSADEFLQMAEIICSTGRADRVGTIMYAVGWTMHTVGSQIIRTAAILQLLLGNIGRPGGGINALRGHANVQGATDHAIVAGILPGYLRVPTPPQTSLAAHLRDSTPQPLVPDTVNYWGNYPKFYVSQMKAWFGENATPENDFAYDYLAKQDGDATWLTIWDKAHQGTLEGFVTLGFNPLLAGPDVPRLLDAMSKLKWKVVIDPFMLDSAEFWKAPGMDPAEIDTEVLYLPSSHWIERDGSFTNSGRWAQWKEKAIDPPIGVRSDTWILSELFWRVKELYQAEGGAWNDAIQHLTWDYLNPREPTMAELAKEINGYDRTTGRLLSSFGELADDGSTTSGNWIYTGSYTEAGNQMQRRGTADPTGLGMHHDWAFSWPANRRVLYNRASADADGPSLGSEPRRHRLERPRVDRRRPRLRPDDAAGRGRRLHHDRGGRGAPVQQPLGRRPVLGALRAGREPVAERAARQRAGQPGHPLVRRGARDAGERQRRLPLRLHRLPGGRARALRHEQRAAAGRGDARLLRRAARGAGRGEGDSRTAARCASGPSGARCRGRPSSPSASSRCASTAGWSGRSASRCTGASSASRRGRWRTC